MHNNGIVLRATIHLLAYSLLFDQLQLRTTILASFGIIIHHPSIVGNHAGKEQLLHLSLVERISICYRNLITVVVELVLMNDVLLWVYLAFYVVWMCTVTCCGASKNSNSVDKELNRNGLYFLVIFYYSIPACVLYISNSIFFLLANPFSFNESIPKKSDYFNTCVNDILWKWLYASKKSAHWIPPLSLSLSPVSFSFHSFIDFTETTLNFFAWSVFSPRKLPYVPTLQHWVWLFNIEYVPLMCVCILYFFSRCILWAFSS